MQPHSLVRTNHRVRTGAFLYSLATIGAHLWEREAGLAAWIFLVIQFAVYPHVVYLRALHSTRPRRAELDNLLLDSVLLGAWCGLLGFPLWIAYGLVQATALNAVVNRGATGLAASLGCNAAGAALGVAIGGVAFAPETSGLVTAFAAFGSLAYACAVGYVVHVQTRRLAQTRDALRASELRYRLIAENAGDLIALVDQRGRWQYWSPSYARLLDPAELAAGGDAFQRLHPDDAERARVAVVRAAATGKAREMAARLVDRDGRMRQLRMRMQAIEEARQVVLVSQDVTDLRESEERLLLAAHALEGMTEAILITSADGTVVTVNKAFTTITGYSREDVLGNPEKEIRNALQPPEFYDDVYAAVTRDGYWSGTTWSRRRNGSVYREWRSLRAVRDAAGRVTHYVSVFYEVGARDARPGEGETLRSS